MKAKATKKAATRARKRKAPARSTGREAPVQQLIKQIVQALDAKKAQELRVLNVSRLSSITDYLILATGTSEPHLRALRIELERVLDEQKAAILAVDTTKGSGWVVVDAFDLMVHLFTPESRAKYRMEQLWRDALEVNLANLTH
jgi:ribosome-associated protein